MEQNPIACEACRVKKCKCDRTLPICTQCSSSDSTCQYPQSSKRGIPSGFISNLEQRLLETEAALFEALLFIDTQSHQNPLPEEESLQRGEFIQRGRGQPRDAKVEEWKRLPLNSAEHQRAWMNEKRRGLVVGDRSSSGVEFTTQPRKDVWTHFPMPEVFTQGNAAQGSLIEGSKIPAIYPTDISKDFVAQSDFTHPKEVPMLIDHSPATNDWTNLGISEEAGEGVGISSRIADKPYDLNGMVAEQLSDGGIDDRLQVNKIGEVLRRFNGSQTQTQVLSVLGSKNLSRPTRELSLKDQQRYF
ncbi:hypothetical protein BKA65DRAFT_518696 [Rhexocercosporidium sp. MPI-PUGE-AT-0058]|nr:hypothetical protein BKA65DRAFT_518696 [Rhexocercosporidium sp. MPI-PUGE-AT-0058]